MHRSPFYRRVVYQPPRPAVRSVKARSSDRRSDNNGIFALDVLTAVKYREERSMGNRSAQSSLDEVALNYSP